MFLTRRSFSSGFAALFGARGVPVSSAMAMPARPGADDAYEILLSRYIRIEEEALIRSGGPSGGQVAGGPSNTGGAISFHGRQIERYLGELDLRVDMTASARQIIDEFKQRMTSEIGSARPQSPSATHPSASRTDFPDNPEPSRTMPDQGPPSAEDEDRASEPTRADGSPDDLEQS